MNFILKHNAFLVSLLSLIIITAIVYPHYQYYVDPDAVSYITIAKRYAAGDYQKAVNGYWSPWSCWLTALFIRQGWKAFDAAIFVNTIGAAGFLWTSYCLLILFLRNRSLIFSFTITIALFLVFAIFKQSFDDLWFFFFLLLILRVMLKNSFLEKPYLWLISGLLGTFAYFSKAYAFPYFILLSLAGVGSLFYQNSRAISKNFFLKVTGVMIGSFVLFSFPWLYLLHEKYGVWTTSSAGSLNLSWYLVGHPFYKEEIRLLIPPVYSDSIYFWEDPLLVNGATPYFWSSAHYFFLQIVRTGYNVVKFFNSMNELSCFSLPVLIFYLLFLFSKRLQRHFSKQLFFIAAASILFPLGYFLINFESRYLWFLIPLSLTASGIAFEKYAVLFSTLFGRFLLMIICISYLVFPVWDMKSMYNVGKDDYEFAQRLKVHNIKGSFASNTTNRTALQRMVRIAYFSENPYYYMPLAAGNKTDLLNELQRYPVRYYFQFSQPFEMEDVSFINSAGTAFPLILRDTIAGVSIYKLQD